MSIHRIALLSVAATVFFAPPIMAENPKGGIGLGGTTCGTPFPCQAIKDGTISNDEVVQRGNTCVSQNFNIPNGDFFETYGLNSDNCLETKTLPRAPSGLSVVPVCCIKHDNETTCHMHCKLLGVQ